MHQKRKRFARPMGSARDKLNAVALRGAFILGGLAWAMTGELLVGVLATILVGATCFVSGEMR